LDYDDRAVDHLAEPPVFAIERMRRDGKIVIVTEEDVLAYQIVFARR
jgi:hypothetical protein